MATAHAQDELPLAFTVYTPLLEPEEYQANLHFNPRQTRLTPELMEALRQKIHDANSELDLRQARVRSETEEWGRRLIENGIRDSVDASVDLTVQPNTTRVGHMKDGLLTTVTIRPGEHPHLDDLMTSVHAHVLECHAMIRAAFD